MIIDVHGHYTTAPPALGEWRDRQVRALDGAEPPAPGGPEISDDAIRESIEHNQLQIMDKRGIDLTVFSPQASFMAHHIGDFSTSSRWAAICNDLCHRVVSMYPDRFRQAAMLPQSPSVDPATCVPELERCIRDFDIVGVNLNPDPSGGYWTGPALTDHSWYPIYEVLQEHGLPAMIHVSTSANPVFHTTGAHYLNADTTVVMQLIQGDLFHDFPDLKFVIPHGGGAVPYHWGRFRGLAMALGKPDLEQHLLSNVYFDTCVYHQPGIDLLTRVIPAKNILFAQEMVGAVRDIDPLTGRYFDDTRAYIDNSALDAGSKQQVYCGNATRVYSRLNLKEQSNS